MSARKLTTMRLMAEQRADHQVALDLLRAAHLAELERVAADQARQIEERAQLQDQLQEALAEVDHAKSDQIRMAQDVAGMFNELRALTDRHADHATELERVRDELDRARQDAGLWREETDRERARIANLQADTEHIEREMARLKAELEQARRPWWRRVIGR
jgi:chromosome segregation ATPase